MLNGIEKRQGRTPRAASYVDFFKSVFAELLYVFDNIERCIDYPYLFLAQCGRARFAFATAPLVKKNDVVGFPVEKSHMRRIKGLTGPAMKLDERLTARLSPFENKQPLALADVNIITPEDIFCRFVAGFLSRYFLKRHFISRCLDSKLSDVKAYYNGIDPFSAEGANTRSKNALR